MKTNADILEFRKERKTKNGMFLFVIGLASIIGSRFPEWFEGLPLWVLPVFGIGCLIPGLWILFGLSVHHFNRKKGTVTSLWGVIVPFKRTIRQISEFKTVLIYKERQSETRSRGISVSPGYQDHKSFFIYPVKVVCEDDPPEKKLIDLLDSGKGGLDTLKALREHGVKLQNLEMERKRSGCASLTIGKPRNYVLALEMGKQLSDFLEIKLCDLGVHK